MEDDPLRKICPLYQHIKDKCSMLYQPLQNVNADERMVKRKAPCHLAQYIKINLTCGGSNTGLRTALLGIQSVLTIIQAGKLIVQNFA